MALSTLLLEIEALVSNTTGYYNTANGYRALLSNNNTTGSYNIGMGYACRLLLPTTVNNQIAIGITSHAGANKAIIRQKWQPFMLE